MKQIDDNIYIRLSVPLFLYNEHRTFTRFEAYIYLILKCEEYEENKLRNEALNNKSASNNVKSFSTTYSSLAGSWQWSVNKVKKYLMLLESEELIRLTTSELGIVITIMNDEELII